MFRSDDDVFGKKLEEKLKERKEQKDLKDLIPEWTNQKRKFSENTDNSGNNKKKQTVKYDKQQNI